MSANPDENPVPTEITQEVVTQVNKFDYSIKRLWSRHKEILRLNSTGLYTTQEIADIVGVTRATVNRTIHSELGKQLTSMLEGAADERSVDITVKIRAMAPIALAVQEEMLLDDDTPLKLRSQIADKMLDRAGYTPIQRKMNLNMNGTLNKEDLGKIKERALELKNAQLRRNEIQEVQDA